MNRSRIARNIKIVFISFLILGSSELFTFKYLYLYRISDIFIPLAIGIFLIYRYGPIVMISMYASTMIMSYFFWGHPAFAIPINGTFNVFFLLFSWLFYIKWLKGNPSLPNVAWLLKYLLFGIIIPLFFYLIYLNFLLKVLIQFEPDPFWTIIYKGFLGDLMATISISFFLLYFFYDFKFENGRFLNHLLKKFDIKPTELVIAIITIVTIFIILSFSFDFVTYWYLYGFLLLVFSLRYGFGMSVFIDLILFIIVYLIPAVFHFDISSEKFEQSNIIEVFYGLTFLSIFALIMGRNVSDKNQLLFIERNLVKELQQTNKLLATAKQYFAKIFESSPNLIAIIREKDGEILNLNSEGLNMLQVDHNSSQLSVSVWEIMAGEDWERICKNHDFYHQYFEINLIRNDRSFVLCEVKSRVLIIDGETHYLINAVDISQKRDTEEKVRLANQEKIELNRKISEYKMMALRSAMSPHFIFNCLNSIQFFILKNNKKEAVHYLTIFSKLVRNVLNMSTKSMVTLEVELEMVRYYITLEQMRFDNKFEVIFDIEETVDLEDTEVPPLLLQPYVENAILHGLSHKQGKGLLQISIKYEGECLRCVIEDDGVGREYSMIMKEKKPQVLKHKSKGMSMTKERIGLINNSDLELEGVHITDLKDKQNKPVGTRVDIFIAIE